MKKLSLVINVVIITITMCNGQSIDSALIISDETKAFIHNWAMQDILDYRIRINPEFSDEKIIKSYVPKEYYSYNDKIFSEPLIDNEGLVLHISRWPKDNPKTNYYMVTKDGNRFVRYPRGSAGTNLDTVIIADYEKFNKYYFNDDVFVVYYDGKGVYRNVSGNFIQNSFSVEWFDAKNAPSLAVERRLAQYNVGHPYSIKETPSDWILLFSKCDLVKSDPGAFIVKMRKKGYYSYFEIIYYSNNKLVTGDENLENIYEVKFVRDYSKGLWPTNYKDTLPRLRLIKKEEVTTLNKYYGEVIYKFGDIDYSIFNKD